MDTFEAIFSRRAVKHYDPGHEFSDEEVRKLMEAAVQAPTSFNIQHWRFVLVRDKALRGEIRAVANDQAQVTDASLLIVMTADLKAWQKSPERYWRDAPPDVGEMLVNWLGPFYEGKDELQRDEAMRSSAVWAGQTIMLAAKAMGYDSCPMIGFDAERRRPAHQSTRRPHHQFHDCRGQSDEARVAEAGAATAGRSGCT